MYDAELMRLQAQFDQLVASVQAGHLAVDDAMASLAGMVAVDGSGAEWRLDAGGQFFRSFPGAQPVPADPKTFVPMGAQTGSSGLPGTWGSGPDLAVPPFRVPPAGFDNSDATGLSPHTPPVPLGGPPVGLDPRSSRSLAFEKLPGLLQGRARTVLVVSFCVLVVLVLFAGGGKNGTGNEDPAPSPTAQPSSSTQPSAAPSATVTIKLPTPAQAAGVVKLLAGKDRKGAVSVAGQDKATLLEYAAPFAAAANLGFKLSVSSVVQVGEAVHAVVEIRDGNALVSTWGLPLRESAGRWVVAGAPKRR